MKISPKILDLIKTDVAFRPIAYKKDKHFLIGFEHPDPSLMRGDAITEAEALALLQSDLEVIALQLDAPFRKLPPIPSGTPDPNMARQFPSTTPVCDRQHMFDALVALAFHIGVDDLLKSSLWKALSEAADEPTIRSEFERWVFEDGKPHQHMSPAVSTKPTTSTPSSGDSVTR